MRERRLSTIARTWLGHPATRGLDLDDPRTTTERRRIISSKRFLRLIYEEWYARLVDALPAGDSPVLEIGSGAGFLSTYIPGLITSDVFMCDDLKVVLDAGRLPFADASLRAVVMTNVLHHLPKPTQFFEDATRCVRGGGSMHMIEPWVSAWSRFVYGRLHHEPFDPEADDWEFSRSGPLSAANGAIPWLVFERDRTRFEQRFEGWAIRSIKPMMPFRYLLSGGVSMRGLMPGGTFHAWRRLEGMMAPRMKNWAMFAEIHLDRITKA